MKIYSHIDSAGVPLQSKLDSLFQEKQNGFFVELGAFDGFCQSNTAFLEKERGWRGILIEPCKQAYDECVKNRPNSQCIHGACVANDYPNKTIQGDFTNYSPMMSIDGKRLGNKNTIEVPAYTLQEILTTHAPNQTIDFLSLDVEGYELNVLRGLDLNVIRPEYMLIEVYKDFYLEIVDHLEQHSYALHSNFSNFTKETTPNWDGTHNDFLFYDTRKGKK
jgi:FkbM family methyltransferase